MTDERHFVSLPSRERGLKYLLQKKMSFFQPSLPSRERGLKSDGKSLGAGPDLVAPLAGAWIEIKFIIRKYPALQSRSSRGSVDWNLQYATLYLSNKNI